MAVCRSCNESKLLPVLSLGNTPLANALLTRDELDLPEDVYPLDLVFCPNCALLQITETISPKKLFREYLYFSSISDTILQNARKLSSRIITRCNLNKNSLVIEVASNDGYLLKNYVDKEIPVLGVEPAKNVAQVAMNQNVSTINDFFSKELGEKLRNKGLSADVIHANNVVAHVANLHSVVEGMALLLKPDGVAVIENHYARDLIDQVEFDQIYHEHLCYYSATSFRNLFIQHGLALVDIEHIHVHGGSLRAYFQRKDGPCSLTKESRDRVSAFLNKEKLWGVRDYGTYKNFGEKVKLLRKNLLVLLENIIKTKARIAVYGASAKSTTLLNYFEIGKETVEYVIDRSTVKQGRFTPGTHLPIYSPEYLLEDFPDYVLILSWNFADEIMAQQSEYHNRGGKFIIPIPELKVV
jgi:SAM-dependent methyltransferase